MAHRVINLSEEQFDRLFPLVRNHLDSSATWSVGETGGCLFGLSAAEIAFVAAQDPCCVWTWVDGDEGQPLVLSGFHYVNRIGYLVSTRPRRQDLDVEVTLESFADDEEDGADLDQGPVLPAADPRG